VRDRSEARARLAASLAIRMLSGGLPAYGLLLLAELGDLEEAAGHLAGKHEKDQAAFVRRVAHKLELTTF
jgi:hypothetical protein